MFGVFGGFGFLFVLRGLGRGLWILVGFFVSVVIVWFVMVLGFFFVLCFVVFLNYAQTTGTSRDLLHISMTGYFSSWVYFLYVCSTKEYITLAADMAKPSFQTSAADFSLDRPLASSVFMFFHHS